MEYLTQDKKQELENELHHLTTVRRKEVADALNYAKSLGDLSENAEYNQAREDQAYCEDRISELEAILKNAVIMDAKADGIVHVGATFVIKEKGAKDTVTYTLVGQTESNIREGRVSNESPLGKAVLGKKEGDTFIVNAPKGNIEYKVVEIKK